MRKVVVLLSGGLDSTTTLYLAKKQGFKPFCLIFDYSQRHKKEIESAKKIAQIADCQYQIVKIDLAWKGSSLLDRHLSLPRFVDKRKSIPSTYVPSRNLIFLSFALSFAESIKAEAIFIGANAIDFSGYPDCKPQFYQRLKKVIEVGTKSGVCGKAIKIHTPLIKKTKAEIVKLGFKLGAPLEYTWSCYAGGRKPCGICDSCKLRKRGFAQVKISDPALN